MGLIILELILEKMQEMQQQCHLYFQFLIQNTVLVETVVTIGGDEKNNPKKYVERILNEKYGKGNWKKGQGKEYNKILKAITRGGHKAWNSIK